MRAPSLAVSTVVAVVPTSRPEAEMSIDTSRRRRRPLRGTHR
jgi:hypothetical protein